MMISTTFNDSWTNYHQADTGLINPMQRRANSYLKYLSTIKILWQADTCTCNSIFIFVYINFWFFVFIHCISEQHKPVLLLLYNFTYDQKFNSTQKLSPLPTCTDNLITNFHTNLFLGLIILGYINFENLNPYITADFSQICNGI